MLSWPFARRTSMKPSPRSLAISPPGSPTPMQFPRAMIDHEVEGLACQGVRRVELIVWSAAVLARDAISLLAHQP